jgi:hypothetical protein
MMKNIADINGNLMDMHKKKKEFEQSEQKALPQGQTTNNVFVGSTADLQRMLQSEMIDVTPNPKE